MARTVWVAGNPPRKARVVLGGCGGVDGGCGDIGLVIAREKIKEASR